METKTLWSQILSEMEQSIGKDAAEMWLKPINPLVFNNNVLKLEVPNQVWYQTIKDRYENKILSVLKTINGQEVILEYTIPMGHSTQQKPADIPAPVVVVEKKKGTAFPNRLNPNYTFEAFIEGPSNRFAYRAAQAVVKKLGDRSNNPFVVFSSPGLGKTHLLHAIGNEILKGDHKSKILYMSGEEFVNEYIQSLQNKTSETFRNKYRSLDCFLVDDIQFVAGKDRSEQEFFYTFNTLFESKKQIVLTSDRTPNELELDKRLASRLLSGIVAEINVPDVETRIAILRQKRDIHRFNIPDDVIGFIGEHAKTSIREMEGCLYRVDSYSTIHGVQPTVDIIKEVLADMLDLEEKRSNVDIDSIIKIVSKHFKIDIKDFKSQKRTHSISWPRQIAMYLSNELTDFSLPEIGKAFDRDHSTVVHARDQVKKEIDENPFFSAEINQIISEVKAVDKH